MSDDRQRLRLIEGGASELRERLVAQAARLDTLVQERERIMENAVLIAEAADLTLHARLLLETFSEEEQMLLRDRVQALVTRGLQIIFGPDYSFEIEVTQLRKQVAMVFTIHGRDPLGSQGGGVANVVALVLRLVVVALTPGLSRTVVLDEPFAQLSQAYLEPMGRFLQELVRASGTQLLIVSHEPEIAEAATHVYRLTLERGTTQIERAV